MKLARKFIAKIRKLFFSTQGEFLGASLIKTGLKATPKNQQLIIEKSQRQLQKRA